MKRLLILAALAMVTLNMAGCCRNPCRQGLFGGGLFGHRGERDNDRECCSSAPSEMSGGCDSCGGGAGPGDFMMGPPPTVIGPPSR
jgi:hypothetical protein